MRSPYHDDYRIAAVRPILARVLADFVITDPIKTLFAPRFRIDAELDCVALTITSLNADGSEKPIDVRMVERIPPFDDEGALVHFLYELLSRAMLHEIAESTLYRGSYVKHPHPGGGRQ